MMPSVFKFTTRDHTKKPVEVAGRTFFGKPLTAAEEDTLQELQILQFTRKPSEQLREEVAAVHELLSRRVAGSDEVALDWVTQHFGRSNADALIAYLRTGTKAHGPLDLVVFPEPIELDDRSFTPRAMSFAEQASVVVAMDELNALETLATAQQDAERGDLSLAEVEASARTLLDITQRANLLNAELLARLLNARATSGDQTITAVWLRDTLPAGAIGQLNLYLRTGELPEAESEDAAPNA